MMPELNLPKTIEPMAVVGMEIRSKGIRGLDDLFQMITTGQSIEPLGSPSDGSNGLDQAIEKALSHAGIALPLSPGIKPGFLFAQTAGTARPINLSKWGQSGQVMDFSGMDNPIQEMLLQASQWLAAATAQVVLLIAENPIDGDGISVLVLQKPEKARLDGRTIYGLIRSIGFAPGSDNGNPADNQHHNAVKNSALAAMKLAGINRQAIGYVETFSASNGGSSRDGITELCQVYQGDELLTAIGRLNSSLAITGLTAIIKTVLCLYYRVIPACSYPGDSSLWAHSQFYLPSESRAWFQPADHPTRLAAVNLIESSGACTHLILSDVERTIEPANPALRGSKFYLLPVSASNPFELPAQLSFFKKAIEGTQDIAALADEAYLSYQRNGLTASTVGFVAHNPVELLREVDMAIKGIPAAVQKQGDWQTPNGSYFTSNPLGLQGKLAFVYPGAFNSYPGMGKDLFTLFPHLYQHMSTITRDIGEKLREKLLYPRSQTALDDDSLKKIETALQADAIAMLITGTSMAFLLTSVLRDVFAIRPSAAFGYSLGELSMAFATGVWTDADACSTRLESSPVFVNRLAGPQNAVRDAWGLPAQASQDQSNLWANYVIMSTPEAVMEQVKGEDRVYLTHINTPRQVVIGGDPAACQRVIAALHCSALQAPFNYALHCDAMRSEYEGLVYLHSWPVKSIPEVTLYSAANYAPADITEAGLGHGIARALTHPLDFPKLIQQVYSSGVKLFIEVGAGSNCSRWVDESLKDQPHVALSVNRRGADDHTSILRLLSRLISHQVKLDLSPLYRQDNPIPAISPVDDDWQAWA